MLYLWTTAKAKWLLVALLLFCMHLHETKSIVYFDHFWCRLKRTMNKWILNYLWKLCWILVGMFNKEFHFVTYIKFSQDIANVCLPSDFFHDFFSELLMQFDLFFIFNQKPYLFAKRWLWCFQNSIPAAYELHNICSSVAHQKFKITSSKWQEIESDRALTRSFLWSL